MCSTLPTDPQVWNTFQSEQIEKYAKGNKYSNHHLTSLLILSGFAQAARCAIFGTICNLFVQLHSIWRRELLNRIAEVSATVVFVCLFVCRAFGFVCSGKRCPRVSSLCSKVYLALMI